MWRMGTSWTTKREDTDIVRKAVRMFAVVEVAIGHARRRKDVISAETAVRSAKLVESCWEVARSVSRKRKPDSERVWVSTEAKKRPIPTMIRDGSEVHR